MPPKERSRAPKARQPKPGRAPKPRPEGRVRTCAITRTPAKPAELIRLVAMEDGQVVVDRSNKLPGRGVWVLPTLANLQLVESRPAILAKAIGIPTCNPTGIIEQTRQVLLARVLDLLSLAARAGLAASGELQVEEAIRAGTPALLAATDASPQTIVRVKAQAPQARFVSLPLDKEALGHRIGKGPRAIVALRPGSVTRSLLQQLPPLEELR